MTFLTPIGSRLRTHRATAVAVGVVVLVATPTGFVLPAETWGALGQWGGHIARGEATAQAARTQTENREKEISQARLVTAEISPAGAEVEDRYGASLPDHVVITNHRDGHVFVPQVEGFVHPGG